MSEQVDTTANASQEAVSEQTQVEKPTEEQVVDTFYAKEPESKETSESEAKAEVNDEPAKEGEASKEAEPEKEVSYDLKLNEESVLHESVVESIKEFAKENGLTNEAAQKMLDQQNGLMDNFVKQQQEQWDQQVDSWVDELKNDPEYGGDKFNETTEYARRTFSRFAPESFVELINETGYGNHPELVKLFARIGREMEEDRIVTSTKPGNSQVDFAEKFYSKQA